MSEHTEGAPEDGGPVSPPNGVAPDPTHATRPTPPSLTTQVRRRRADQAFFLRLRDVIQQNHRALERLGT
jgi:hypothetical protein